MSYDRQLVYWIITVLIGSLITAIGLAVISFKQEPFEFYILIFLTSCLISFFASTDLLFFLSKKEPKNDLWQSPSLAARIQPELCIRKSIPASNHFKINRYAVLSSVTVAGAMLLSLKT